MRIRQELHLIEVDGEIVLPFDCYTLTTDEKKSVLQWLSDIRVPDGYSANLSRCVNVKDGKISSMKTHDCHVFLERFLHELKRYVRNKARPEGSIAEGYLVDECLTFALATFMLWKLNLIDKREIMMEVRSPQIHYPFFLHQGNRMGIYMEGN
ncbi:hypothetical protein AB3S75_012925 [Citrus x aurantiifolia]